MPDTRVHTVLFYLQEVLEHMKWTYSLQRKKASCYMGKGVGGVGDLL